MYCKAAVIKTECCVKNTQHINRPQQRRDVDPQTYSRVNGFLKRRKDELIEEKIVFSINGMGTIGCPYAKDKNLKKKRF